MPSNVIGLRIAKLREARGLSQYDLRDELKKKGLDVRRETITQWENGTRDLKTEYTIKLAEYFQVSTDYILGISDVQTTNTDIKAFCECTGLTESAVSNLIRMQESNTTSVSIKPLSELISSGEIIGICSDIFKLKDLNEEYKRATENITLTASEFIEMKLKLEKSTGGMAHIAFSDETIDSLYASIIGRFFELIESITNYAKDKNERTSANLCLREKYFENEDKMNARAKELERVYQDYLVNKRGEETNA